MTQSKARWLSAGIVFALSAASCGDSTRDHQFEFYALGTEVSITLYGVGDEQARLAEQRLQLLFADVGHNWYPWRPGELQSINEAFRELRVVDVSPRLATVIHRAAEIEVQSGGLFNAGLGRLTELWGLDDITTAPDHEPDPSEIDALLASKPAISSIRWDGEQIAAAQSTLSIDLGGIAKGAILEDSIGILRELGIGNAIVNIGGDLSVLGDVNGRPARIGIRSPSANGPVAAIDVAAGETIVTSGNYERYIEIAGRRFTHILDPRTGYPVEHSAAVTVVHTDPILADAAATALMVGGTVEFDALTQALDIDFALLIDASGDLRLTPAMNERLDWILD